MSGTQLAETGVTLSRVGLGCNQIGNPVSKIGLEETRAIVDAAIAAGVTHLDTADAYGDKGGSETLLGEVLKGRRDSVVLATKFGNDMAGRNGEDPDLPKGSAAYVRLALERSLERLQTDYVDLFYYHRPDGVTPLDETLGAMSELVDEGKARAIACSNFTPELLREGEAVAAAAGSHRFVALQNDYNLINRTAETTTLPVCLEAGIGFIPYFPLANGLLTGKYRRGEPAPEGSRLQKFGREPEDADLVRVEALDTFARAHGHTLLELAISALASRPGIASVITGATRPEQVSANCAAGAWQLTDAQLAELASL